MRIIRAREGESIYAIAAECGIAPQLLKEISGVDGRTVNEGREIGAYTPSRSYVVRTGDSLCSICERFGVREREVVRLNPELADGRLYRGQYLALGLCEGKVGALAVNGYMYRGCTGARMRAVLPYLNTLTVAAARATGKDIRIDGGMVEAARIARGAGVSPYLRIYLDGGTDSPAELAIGCVMMARTHGFDGVVLGGLSRLGRAACELTVEARRRTMEDGLTLGVEGELGGEGEYTEYADFCILTYDKLHLDRIPSLADGERAALERYAEKYEILGAMIDLPAFAISRGGYVSRERAIAVGDRRGGKFEHADGGGYMRVSRGRESLLCENTENVEARIRMAAEYGMLGVSFDVSRLPFSEVYMTGAMVSAPCNFVRCEPTLDCRGEQRK